MVTTRFSARATRNDAIETFAPKALASSNRAWLEGARAHLGERPDEVRLLLLGGSDPVHFQVRVAQAVLRRDRLPSFFSHVVVLDAFPRGGAAHVPLLPARADRVPLDNGIERTDLRAFDDPAAFPNVALLAFPVSGAAGAPALVETIATLRMQRLSVDLVSPLVAWLAHLWGARAAAHPLEAGIPVPSALLADEACARLGLDLTPGLTERAACPEAIWQAALHFRDFYANTLAPRLGESSMPPRSPKAARIPRGRFLTRQPEAAAVESR